MDFKDDKIIEFAEEEYPMEQDNALRDGYKKGFKKALELIGQGKIDSSDSIRKIFGDDIGDFSDGYHTFNELYDFRREYNAALVNTGIWKSHKSYRHSDGELCFGGGWFIVMIDTPYGQISNHYENKYWNEFHCEEKETADNWDGHTEKDVLFRLTKCNKDKNSFISTDDE